MTVSPTARYWPSYNIAYIEEIYKWSVVGHFPPSPTTPHQPPQTAFPLDQILGETPSKSTTLNQNPEFAQKAEILIWRVNAVLVAKGT